MHSTPFTRHTVSIPQRPQLMYTSALVNFGRDPKVLYRVSSMLPGRRMKRRGERHTTLSDSKRSLRTELLRAQLLRNLKEAWKAISVQDREGGLRELCRAEKAISHHPSACRWVLRKDVVRTCHRQGHGGPSLTASLTALRLRACKYEVPHRTCLLYMCVTLSALNIA